MGDLRSFRSTQGRSGDGRPRHTHKRGWPWVAAAVVLCPCHLPLTLGALGGVFGGVVTGNAIWIWVGVTAAFAVALWRAMRRFRGQEDCPACRSGS